MSLSIEKLVLPHTLNQLFAAFLDWPRPVLLASLNASHPDSKYSIISANPYKTLTFNSDQLISDKSSCPFELLKKHLPKMNINYDTPFPFLGGAIGYFSYDLGRMLETIPCEAEDDLRLPLMDVGFYHWAIIADHSVNEFYLVYLDIPEKNVSKKDILDKLQQNSLNIHTEETNLNYVTRSTVTSNFTQAAYAQAFEKIQRYIYEGDCYQVNLAQRWKIPFYRDPFDLYTQLSAKNNNPFCAYLSFDNYAIISVSPERFLSLKDNKLSTKPIKGTRPRHLDPHRDKQIAQELKSSLKDRAENLMIVDLLRNDFGKVCKPGSIKVPKLFDIESFPAVHHLVSTIEGELQEALDACDALRACFPGGSITGAPKIRSMEIIEQLEPHRRSIYCGSIGYIDVRGHMDTNIAIRTLVCKNHNLYIWAGGGIVADSNVDLEYQETFDKVSLILSAL